MSGTDQDRVEWRALALEAGNATIVLVIDVKYPRDVFIELRFPGSSLFNEEIHNTIISL